MGPCDRGERRICTKEGKGLSVVEREKEGGKRVYQRAFVEKIYLTIKITTDGTGVLCRKKRWEEADGAELLISE